MRAALQVCTATLLVLSLGLHWGLLQTVAWTDMLIRYSHEGSFKEAIIKTFDGEHPCSLCQVVRTGRAEEQKQERQQSNSGSKLDAGLIWQATLFDFRCERPPAVTSTASPTSRGDEPPKPRPRPC